MTKEYLDEEHVLVPCRMCLAEVPISEIIVSEATDYVAHFCGLDCFNKWRTNPNNPALQKIE